MKMKNYAQDLHAMSFGGRERDVYLEGKQRTIGRFGWGLSATVSCLAKEEGRAMYGLSRRKMMLGDIVSGSMMTYWLTTVL